MDVTHRETQVHYQELGVLTKSAGADGEVRGMGTPWTRSFNKQYLGLHLTFELTLVFLPNA